MKTNKQIQADFKKRKRESGYTQKTIWIHTEDWEAVKQYISDRERIRVNNR